MINCQQVNQAYHALMDGKESTHSSSTETSTTTCGPTGSSTGPTPSDSTHPKSTQASSRPPSASSDSSKRSGPRSSNTSASAPWDDHGANASKSGTRSKASPSSSPASPDDDPKSSSHPRPARARVDRDRSSSDRGKSGRKFFKSQNHLRDPTRSAASKAMPPASTHTRDSEDPSGSVRSKSSEKTSSPGEPETPYGSRPEKTSHAGSGRPRASKPVIPSPSGRLHKSSKFGFAE